MIVDPDEYQYWVYLKFPDLKNTNFSASLKVQWYSRNSITNRDLLQRFT